MPPIVDCDTVVIGGGFYGVEIASYLSSKFGHEVILLEQESGLLTRASFTNQARVHNGYHYPRNFVTAYRSRVNLPKFLDQYGVAVSNAHTKIYAVAKHDSKVSAGFFEAFCRSIGASLETVPMRFNAQLNNANIAKAWEAIEPVFDAVKLMEFSTHKLINNKVTVKLNSKVASVSQNGPTLIVEDTSGTKIKTRNVFNCTYSRTNHIEGLGTAGLKMKHEITEMALVQLPESLKGIALTVMDGPFFSLMPFPAKNAHTLSHVRYTPHVSWMDHPSIDPYAVLSKYPKISMFGHMQRDTARYLPEIMNATYLESLFEVKTVLINNEDNDGRPILFQPGTLANTWHVLGGKIDNIFDILEKVGELVLESKSATSA